MDSEFQLQLEQQILAFFKERVGEACCVYRDGAAWLDDLKSLIEKTFGECPPLPSDAVLRTAVSNQQALALDASYTLVVAEPDPGTHLLAVIQGPQPPASRLVQTANEAWTLSSEVRDAQSALEESAMQLAQSFEEQNWLRGLAKNATSISGISSGPEIANGILQPLGYLLRAQDVFLVVSPEETVRSGLISTKFGDSCFSILSIQQILCDLGFNLNSQPLVKNRLSIETPDGKVDSILAVSVDQCVGYLVAINRSTECHANGLPVYDPEFGSCEVGLLEEAAVLLSTQAQNLHLLTQSNQLFMGTLHAMSSTIDARDPYTQGHSERVARLSFELAKILGLSIEAAHEIYLAGILHDIGKIGIPDNVLLKNGALTDEEYAIIKKHPEIGYRIVERLGHLQFTLPGVLYHHERWDGKGYPSGLAGHAIPLMARVMAVADAFDAMTSSRPYRNAMPIEKAHGIILSGAGEQWDAEVVACFDQWLKDRQQCTSENNASQTNVIIPQDSLMEQMTQAVMTLFS